MSGLTLSGWGRNSPNTVSFLLPCSAVIAVVATHNHYCLNDPCPLETVRPSRLDRFPYPSGVTVLTQVRLQTSPSPRSVHIRLTRLRSLSYRKRILWSNPRDPLYSFPGLGIWYPEFGRRVPGLEPDISTKQTGST